ncbi:MAG: AAA family ATPase [Paramuribaculum sp.]|nr:AAA family ATPase [Paramuribaculum sp.]
MKFSDIPSHEEVKSALRNMVNSGQIPHAILLEGPAGIGKFAMARALAQYIQCTDRDANGDSCGKCKSCLLHQSLNHIDVTYVFPVVKLDSMKSAPVSDDFLAEWNDFFKSKVYLDINAWSATFSKKNAQPVTYVTESASLIHKLAFTTHISSQRIVLWWLPERMNEEAANKLLKLIEEPYENTIFIMVSDSPQEILPTIYSRVQRINMKRLPDDIITDNLMTSHPELSRQNAMALAHISNGSMIAAERHFEWSGESTEFLDLFMQLMRLAYQRKIKELRSWANNLADMNRDKQMRFYDYTMHMIRENFILNYHVPELTYLNSAESNFSVKFSPYINERNVERLMTVFNNAKTDISGNGNSKIINLDVAIKVILLLK